MNKFLTLGLAFSTALIMSGCSGSADNVTISETSTTESNDDYNDGYNNNDYNDDIYNDDYNNNDDIYSDTDDDFGYDNIGIDAVSIYDLEENNYVIKGYNNYGEDVELKFYYDGGYEYYRDYEYFSGSFSINYGEVQMRDNADGGSYVLASDNDEFVVGGSYYCDALGRVLTITSIEGGNLY